MARESLLIRTLVELADSLVDDFDVIDVLTMLSNRCVEVTGTGAAGVLLSSPTGELHFVASSSESMRILELFQVQTGEGPCVDCFRDGQPIVNYELSDVEQRWPRFAPLDVAQGFHSVDRMPMRLRGRTIGALNLFLASPGELTADDVLVAQGLADVATNAISQHRNRVDEQTLNDQLGLALNSRIIIEQAKGMVSQISGCDMDIAFARMRARARNHNEGLTEVARAIVDRMLGVTDLDSAASRLVGP
jgi:GAF domain-containing protein